MLRFARNDGCEVTGLPRFPSVARNDEKRGKARLRVGTRVRFLSGGWQGVGTRVRFFAGGWKEVGTRMRFLSGGRQGVGTSMRFLSEGRQEVGTSMRFLSGGRQEVGTRVKSKKLLFILSSPMREQEIIIFSVFLAEEECGLPRFARNDGCEVTGLPRFARNDGGEVTGLPRFARNDGRRNVDCSSCFGRLQ